MYPPYGQPIQYVYVPSPANNSTPNPFEWVNNIEAQIEGLEKLKKSLKGEEKKDDKDSKKKKEMPKFSFGETLGMLLLFSIPITLIQISFLEFVKHAIH